MAQPANAEIEKAFYIAQECKRYADQPAGNKIRAICREIKIKHNIANMEIQERRQASADLPEGVSALTVENLRRHDKELAERRQFGCAPCDSTWWKRVFQHKPVSRCNKCQVKYDPIPKDLEYGIGKFTCQHCGNTFTGWAQYNKPADCHNCNNVQVFPTEGSIGPRQSGPRMRTRNVHSCGMCDYGRVHPCPGYKKVLVASTPHISTGSTVSTFLTQASDLEAEYRDAT
ncbi:shiftless antiviral inhibitor of ribosomal frameshifting protein-like isoform X2 [Branchiostoma floridae]|uniref:Shiftless antiviral inhibitor of ribosomal frameshifting protein-like isoform X2 n=1 Tax=Branchiostoma floridae TaxID=7739 RepID=A0A9J7KRR5_BRAFL|nr:shiftless antiviral inhibitor of ribosomal frameshifting protein-like isoform X2 [Branchiostoma floridae]